MAKIIITKDDSLESPLREFGVRVGDVFDATINHYPDGSWRWVIAGGYDGVDLEIEPDECAILSGPQERPERAA
ncbi:hypothetical protein GWD52_20955 [Enterobacteriaceae bacterium 4M9]|nr:hypothetical protein [Enterobacteriaceae bacterium 4M9]